MRSIDSESTFTPVRLSAGRTLHIPVRPGTAVQVLAGSLRMRGAAWWLAERMSARPAQWIGEGQWLHLEDGGWLEIEAADASDVQLLLVEPPEPMAWLWRRLKSLLPSRAPARQSA